MKVNNLNKCDMFLITYLSLLFLFTLFNTILFGILGLVLSIYIVIYINWFLFIVFGN